MKILFHSGKFFCIKLKCLSFSIIYRYLNCAKFSFPFRRGKQAYTKLKCIYEIHKSKFDLAFLPIHHIEVKPLCTAFGVSIILHIHFISRKVFRPVFDYCEKITAFKRAIESQIIIKNEIILD